mmetsp:Transcript_28398/g.64964  ORF Transcript_28398/g.64964 Transcript_28398/m.64964 type:complete len:251 (-) Transcript_28398:40-792(-)
MKDIQMEKDDRTDTYSSTTSKSKPMQCNVIPIASDPIIEYGFHANGISVDNPAFDRKEDESNSVSGTTYTDGKQEEEIDDQANCNYFLFQKWTRTPNMALNESRRILKLGKDSAKDNGGTSYEQENAVALSNHNITSLCIKGREPSNCSAFCVEVSLANNGNKFSENPYSNPNEKRKNSFLTPVLARKAKPNMFTSVVKKDRFDGSLENPGCQLNFGRSSGYGFSSDSGSDKGPFISSTSTYETAFTLDT